jgi:hypothetical protein
MLDPGYWILDVFEFTPNAFQIIQYRASRIEYRSP